MITGQTRKQINDIDWSFDKSSSSGHITGLHPYPARFIPIIPRTVIDILGHGRSLNILDPFAGCGTTLYEGLSAGHSVNGVDINALAILLQRVYTYPYSPEELAIYESFIKELIDDIKLVKSINTEILIDIPNIDHWFTKTTQSVLSVVLLRVSDSNISEVLKDLVKFAISRVIVKISNQQSDTQYRALQNDLSFTEVINILNNSFTEVFTRFRNANNKWSNRAKIVQGDSRLEGSYIGFNNINLVITSPPYPNAYEYWLYHKYRMYWLDMDPLWCRKNEIGARPYYSGSGKLNEFDFQSDIDSVFSNITKITTKDAVQFWVVGDSIIKGKLVDNVKIVVSSAKKNEWELVDVIDRRLSRTRSSFQGIGRQKKESIIILRKVL